MYPNLKPGTTHCWLSSAACSTYSELCSIPAMSPLRLSSFSELITKRKKKVITLQNKSLALDKEWRKEEM
jgi:hypothetical protein